LADQIFPTSCAGEMVGVVFVSNGGNAFVDDGLFAVGTARAEQFVEVGLAVGITFVLHKDSFGEGQVAVSTDKVLWMESLAQRI